VKLDQYISELLFEHECVIIPGFGGIVANYRPSFLNPAHHTFSPPSKRLAFNASLRTNDGLLASHVSKRLSVNYNEANSYISTFVSDCTKSLQDGQKLVLDKVGVLYLDAEKNLQFMPDASVNYLKASFGLTSLHSPAIRRDETISSEPEKKRKIVKLPKWRVMEVIPVAAMLAYLIINPSVVNTLNSQLASLNPFPKAIVVKLPQKEIDRKKDTNAYLNENSVIALESESSVVVDTVTSTQNAFEETAPVVKEEAPVINLKPNHVTAEDVAAAKQKEDNEVNVKETGIDKTAVKNEVVSNQVSRSKKYYVIGGCFSVEENATKFLSESIAAGFSAEIIGKNPKGMTMVALFSSENAAEAEKQLVSIKEKNAGGAWITRR